MDDDMGVEPAQWDEDEMVHNEEAHTTRKLNQDHGANIVRYIDRLHRNLGHPRPQTLVQMLQAANARP